MSFDPTKIAKYIKSLNYRVGTLETSGGGGGGAQTTTTAGALINSATAKTTPVDADFVGLMDSASSNILTKLSWANVKVTLKTYFDSLSTTLTNKSISGATNTLTSIPQSAIIDLTQVADYIIEKISSTIYARPRNGSGLTLYSGTDAYTVIQAAITALTPSGAQGTGGGYIHVSKGSYTLTNELTITGWETANPPYSQLTISGEGYQTRFTQNTTGKNCFVVKNRASVVLKNMFIGVGTGALSAILFDKTGATSEISVFNGIIDNIKIITSGSAPGMYLKNFFALSVPFVEVYSYNNHAIQLENNSTTTHYGNSNFGQITCTSPVDNNFAGLAITSINNKPLNLCHFDSLCISSVGGYGSLAGKGLYIKGGGSNTFSFVDIEYMSFPIYVDGTAGTIESASNTIQSGYLYPSANGTGIYCAQATSDNRFCVYIEGDDVAIKIIDDNQQFRPANDFDITVGSTLDLAKILIATPNETPIKVKQNGTGLTTFKVPTPSASDNSQKIATTSYVQSKIASLGGGSSDIMIKALTALGSVIKAQSVGLNIFEANTAASMIDGNLRGASVFLETAQTITGLAFILKTAGVFIADQENSIGLFTFDKTTGIATMVAKTANDANYLKGTAGVTQVALTAPYAAAAGIYYVMLLYNSSSQTTAPAVGSGITLGFTNQSLALISGGGKISVNLLGSYNTMPTSSDLNAVQTSNQPAWVALY